MVVGVLPHFSFLAVCFLQIVNDLVKMIVARSKAGKNYGVVMLPEGLIEFIPEFNHLISDINDVLASGIPTTIGNYKIEPNAIHDMVDQLSCADEFKQC